MNYFEAYELFQFKMSKLFYNANEFNIIKQS